MPLSQRAGLSCRDWERLISFDRARMVARFSHSPSVCSASAEVGIAGRDSGIFVLLSSLFSPNLCDSRLAALGLPLSASNFDGGLVGGDFGVMSFSSEPEFELNRDLKPSLANRPRTSSVVPSPGNTGGVITSCVLVVVRMNVNSGTGC